MQVYGYTDTLLAGCQAVLRRRYGGDAVLSGVLTRERRRSHVPTDILIVGAGPTGLVLALWLTRLGVRVRIIDKTSEPGTTSRALAVQARTLELYRQVGLADAVVSRGRKMTAINLWTRR